MLIHPVSLRTGIDVAYREMAVTFFNESIVRGCDLNETEDGDVQEVVYAEQSGFLGGRIGGTTDGFHF